MTWVLSDRKALQTPVEPHQSGNCVFCWLCPWHWSGGQKDRYYFDSPCLLHPQLQPSSTITQVILQDLSHPPTPHLPRSLQPIQYWQLNDYPKSQLLIMPLSCSNIPCPSVPCRTKSTYLLALKSLWPSFSLSSKINLRFPTPIFPYLSSSKNILPPNLHRKHGLYLTRCSGWL